MEIHKRPDYFFAVFIILIFVIACNNSDSQSNRIVSDPDDMNSSVKQIIKESLRSAIQNNGKLDDSIHLDLAQVDEDFYNTNDFKPIWSSKEKWQPLADSLFQFISTAEYEGLFPKDYHFKNLISLKKKLDTDSIKRTDAVLWARAEAMLTDGFMHIIRDLKQGRLMPDSTSAIKDSLISDKFYTKTLKDVLNSKSLYTVFHQLQPKFRDYWELKRAIKPFVDSMERQSFTYVTFPFKKGDKDDSLYFVKTLMKRLGESNCATISGKMPDSLQLAASIKKYQNLKGIKADGKFSTLLARTMNTSDVERFNRIAITLDRYKQLPDTMPDKYIYVNLPSYQLQVWDHDTLALESKVIIGKTDTRTPVLTSQISDLVTYPTWTVPNSIIVKQYLPKLKNNPNYLSRLGLKLVGGSGRTINGGSVNWSRYSRGIPYSVVQASGSNNALGVFKFNFKNKYDVYLHDTNQRYLFSNSSRALSHGCVRVQEWQKLAYYIARNDSLNVKPSDTLKYNTDSINRWMAAKLNKKIVVKNQVTLFIRYFTCAGENGKIKFYDDVYGEDKILREKYLANNK